MTSGFKLGARGKKPAEGGPPGPISSLSVREIGMGHDQLFKEILRGFLPEFLELFFPEVSARLDFSSLRFPNREVFTAFPDGQRREPDVVAELRTREGEPEIIVVHIEVQADVRGDLGKRMLEYYALLWVQFEAPVFPVLLILQGGQEGVGMARVSAFSLRAGGAAVPIRPYRAGAALRAGVC